MTSVFDHPWLSGLFGDEEVRALWSAEAQMAHMLRFEAAWSRALGAGDIALGIEEFEPNIAELAKGSALDGLPIPALVRQLNAEFGQENIHTGATSQDVIDTALTFTMLATIDLVTVRLQTLHDMLEVLENRHGDAPLMGRTRMQAATPIKVADRLTIWRRPLQTHIARLDQMRPRLALLQIGGASGDRREIDEKVIASMEASLGLPARDKAWHAMRDGVGEFASVLSLVSGSLGKMGQDICLMAQQGVDEISISGGGGSSAMPHKHNPILAELLVSLAAFNATQISGMHHAMVHEQERSGAAWTLEWMILPQMALATGRGLAAAIKLTGSITRLGTL